MQEEQNQSPEPITHTEECIAASEVVMPVDDDEEEEIEIKPRGYLQYYDVYQKSESTHTCSKCNRKFIYGDWDSVSIRNERKEIVKKPYFIAAKRDSRKGIGLGSTHKMLQGDDRPENYFQRWGSYITELESLIKEGKHASEIATIMGRTVASINNIMMTYNLRECYVQAQRKQK